MDLNHKRLLHRHCAKRIDHILQGCESYWVETLRSDRICLDMTEQVDSKTIRLGGLKTYISLNRFKHIRSFSKNLLHANLSTQNMIEPVMHEKRSEHDSRKLMRICRPGKVP